MRGLANPFDDPLNRATIEKLTFGEACVILRTARRMLTLVLLDQEEHEHMADDCGDDLLAATENWVTLFEAYSNTSGDDKAFTEEVKNFLLEPETNWGGCDGEIRMMLVENDDWAAFNRDND